MLEVFQLSGKRCCCHLQDEHVFEVLGRHMVQVVIEVRSYPPNLKYENDRSMHL
jgi:hypothetical protein